MAAFFEFTFSIPSIQTPLPASSRDPEDWHSLATRLSYEYGYSDADNRILCIPDTDIVSRILWCILGKPPASTSATST
jgi:hypothetical protein